MESKQLYLVHRNKHREAAKTRRHITPVKEQIKTPEKELNEMKINNLSDAEFKILVIRSSRNLVRTSTA